MLPLALPSTSAPAHLKARLMDRINEEAVPHLAKVLEFAPRPTRRSFFEFFAWQPAAGLLVDCCPEGV